MVPHFAELYHKTPEKQHKIYWHNLQGAAIGLAIAHSVHPQQPLVVITPDIATVNSLADELRFFLGKNSIPIIPFPDWETLPYDHFSPHIDTVSQRLLALYKIPQLTSGIILIAATTLMHRLPPPEYVAQNSFIIEVNDHLPREELQHKLKKGKYTRVAKVVQPGEYAIRGSIIDLFPLGSKHPLRLDFLDTTIDSIRIFNPNTQRSLRTVDKIHLLPAKEYPLTEEAVNQFRQAWRSKFSGDPLKCPLYQNTINQESSPGIEYYLPLFFPKSATFFSYLPPQTITIRVADCATRMHSFWHEIKERYEQLQHDQTHPLVAPPEMFIPSSEIFAKLNELPQIIITSAAASLPPNRPNLAAKFLSQPLPNLTIAPQSRVPLAKLQQFLKEHSHAITLLVTESVGRREALLELLSHIELNPVVLSSWQEFITARHPLAITVAPITQPLYLLLEEHNLEIILITETQIFGEQLIHHHAPKNQLRNPETIIRDLTELQPGAPVVHYEHGIGRYLGLQKLALTTHETEFLVIGYANQAKLYVPVTSLHLISRYLGADATHAPLQQLGSKQWEKTKRAAKLKIRDVAAELLELHAKRAAIRGFAFAPPNSDYEQFAAAFPFTETADQKQAINQVINDMLAPRPMDRLICGDVGFGKTEVAMRAAFLATYSGKQVVILTPTTILAQQHFTNFQDRFATWPIKIALFSRARSPKEQTNIITAWASGKIDIIIGTHKLLQKNLPFAKLGLLIIDEEHRFGVKQKEYIKKLAPTIDTLALTATPIPRTMSMAFTGIRDFSIIATPPAKRLAIKTAVTPRNSFLIKEAILREILRGGQLYFLHNNVTTIEKTAQELQHLVPMARMAIAHGQMAKQELEQIMRDFYHLRTNLLVCTTIIESGIDIPTANTIIIDRADRFGLAQLHQLRGRVGRSHHQAYAYLLTPPPAALSSDAKKRLEAIVAMEDLGAGFVLATHDLEIRGAGELLGENQSGAIHNIGYHLYLELLEQTITALKAGTSIDLDAPTNKLPEIELQIPALLPDNYVHDVSLRLVLYKRIASATNATELTALKVELIDRFGLLPEATKNLFALTTLKLKAQELGISKITAHATKGTIIFTAKPNIDPNTIIRLIQNNPTTYQLKGATKLEFIIDSSVSKLEFLHDLLTQLTP